MKSEHEVVAVITRPDSSSGRGQISAPSPVAQIADELGIRVLKHANLREPRIREELTQLNPDVIAVVAYGALVPSELLTLPRFGWINLHFSLLPAWRGAAPVPYAIRFGDEITGATTFQIDEGLDTGPVFGVVTETIKLDDTSTSLLARLSVSGARLLVQTLSGVSGGQLRPELQRLDEISHAPKITADDCQIDWRQPALAIERQIRAFTIEPGAWTSYAGDRIQIGPVEILPTILDGKPGEIIASKHEVMVISGSQTLRLGRVKAAGKREMLAADWARGRRVQLGEAFSVTKSSANDG